MLSAVADIFKSVAPLVTSFMGWLGVRKARKEGRREAQREAQDQARERGDAFAQRRREMERESGDRFLEEKRKVMREGAGSHEDRFAAAVRKATYKGKS